MLREVIGKVFGSLLPVQAELVLLDVVEHPLESHAKGFGSFPEHVVSEDSVGSDLW